MSLVVIVLALSNYNCSIYSATGDCGLRQICAPAIPAHTGLVCRSCAADSECNSPEMICAVRSGSSACVHKLLVPFDVRDVVGIVAVFFASALAAGGGIGALGHLIRWS